MYERDEPYYRLLAPFCDRLVGRESLLDTVTEYLAGHSATLVLAGQGGAGKSAVAIECARRLYAAREYGFILSLVPKAPLDVLRDLANVLQVEWSTDVDRVKSHVIGVMKERTGLLLIDNLESSSDAQWLEALIRELPRHVKRIITCRVFSGEAFHISVPSLEFEDAKTLMISELTACGYLYESRDRDALEELIALTRHLPLALKWSASVAAHRRSLRDAAARLRGAEHHLPHLFARLFETLTPAARETALISPILGPTWTVTGVALGVERPKEEVRSAFEELRLRRLIPEAPADDDHAARLLPITADCLNSKLREDPSFAQAVRKRLEG